MKWWQYFTLAGGALLTAAPTLAPFIPPPWNALATAAIALVNGAVHLYMAPPKS